ncbi:hypothetical protein ACIBI4_04760 [Streptomyces sp. NPDC050418]|uniref:hypothetical protein n=1 Tax=Streptomyces sp. NPDC050418 TaxID=3365612 RepID=UPI0037B05B16
MRVCPMRSGSSRYMPDRCEGFFACRRHCDGTGRGGRHTILSWQSNFLMIWWSWNVAPGRRFRPGR